MIRQYSYRRTALLVFILIVLLPVTVLSQGREFEQITTLDGLSQDIITYLHRDRFGFLWIGTEDGLNQYDGYSIRVFKHNPSDTATISSNWIQGICDYGEEDLLITTQRGISIYRRSSDSFTQPQFPLSRPDSPEYGSLLRDRAGDYWIVRSGTDIIRCSPDFGKISLFDTRIEGDSGFVNSLFLDSRGRILAATTRSLLIFESQYHPPRVLRIPHPFQPVPSQLSVVSIEEYPAGVFWLGTDFGLYRYDEQTNNLQFVSLFGDSSRHEEGRDLLFDLQVDRAGRLWVAGFGGLYCYYPNEHRSVRFTSLRANAMPRDRSRIYNLLIDPAEILWIGSWNEGLYKKDLHNEQFGLHRLYPDPSNPLRELQAAAICQDADGFLWVGSQDDGVMVIDSAGNVLKHLNASAKSAVRLSGETIRALYADSLGNVWISSAYSTIDWYNIRSRILRHISIPRSMGAPSSILALAKDAEGQLWICTEATGVFRYNLKRGTLSRISGETDDSLRPPLTAGWSLFPEADGDMWIGGWVGNGKLHRWDAQSQKVHSYDAPELSIARSLAMGEPGALWVGTWGHGLSHFNPASLQIRNYTEWDGLPSNFVKGVLRDRSGKLWISTERGLSRFDPEEETFRNYDVSDGLQDNFFYSGSCTRGRDGRLYFGGLRGINAFFPDSIRDIHYIAPVVLTSFRIFDDIQRFDRSIGLLPQVELRYGDNLFAFEYVAIDYRAPARNRYAYMMEGFNDGWIQAGTRRYVSYTHLNPGDYVFKVKGTNSDGIWSSDVASIKVRILPVFWQTLWFQTASVGLLTLLIYFAYRYRLNKLLEIERTRAAIATDLHDDIGTSLTNIALFSDLAQRDVAAGSAEARQRLEKISQTSRSLLDSMNDIVWSIKPENDALEQTILRMEDYAVEMLEENGIDLHVEIPNNLKTLKLPMAVRRNLFLIFKEAIGNVLKHAEATEVDVVLSSASSGRRLPDLLLQIKDNGKGFVPAMQKRGNGLGNMERRVHHLRGEITITSAEKRGTTIEVRVPLKSPI